MSIHLIYILAGVVLLFFGRKMIWFVLGCIGFVAGFSAVGSFLKEAPYWLPIVVGAAGGVLLVVLVKTLKNLAFGLGGFILGAYVAYNLLQMLNFHPGALEYGIYILGGLIFAGLLLSLFDKALILVSSILGAMLIVQNISVEIVGKEALFFILMAFGVIVQIALAGRKRNQSLVG
jgi:hypothetical protein